MTKIPNLRIYLFLKPVCFRTCLFPNLSASKPVCFQTCLFRNLSVSEPVCFQTCLFLNLPVPEPVCFRTCLFPNLSVSEPVYFRTYLFPNPYSLMWEIRFIHYCFMQCISTECCGLFYIIMSNVVALPHAVYISLWSVLSKYKLSYFTYIHFDDHPFCLTYPTTPATLTFSSIS